MRVAIRVTVEMSPEDVAGYCRDNAVDPREIRQDIKDYVRTALQDSPAFTYHGVVSVT